MSNCSRCGAALAPDAPSGICPRCLLQLGLGEDLLESASTIDEESDIGAPEWIGPYRLLEKIGEGGMGEVFRAEQREPIQRIVALKRIKLGMDSREVLARFESERQALALLSHPGIARVFDAGTTPEGRPYFAMEYIAGLPITDFCDLHRIGSRERIDLFLQVCQALHHAHQRGILHRDIKPSNVLVTFEDGRPQAKIIDFGVAKALHQRLTEKTFFTQRGVILGTPEYMSPEQMDGLGLDVDTTSDVYSLGVLLYVLLCGSLPFEPRRLRQAGWRAMEKILREEEPPKPSTKVLSRGEDVTEIARQRHTDPPSLVRQLRGDLDWIVLKALSKERARRYPSASELGNDLERHLRNEPVVASPPSVAYRTRKFVLRHRWGVAAAGALLASLVAGLAATAGMYARAESARGDLRREALRLHRAEGLRLASAHDRSGSLLWLTGALDLVEDPAEERELRIGLGLVLRETPRLASFWVSSGRLRAVSWNPSGTALLEQRIDGNCSVRRVHDGHVVLGPLPCVPTTPFSQPWARDGSIVAIAGSDGSVALWDVERATLSGIAAFHGPGIVSLAMDRTGERLLVGSEDGRISLWRIASKAEPICEFATERGLEHVALSPRGDRFLSGYSNWSGRIFDTATCAPVSPFLMGGVYRLPGSPRSALFSHDGSLVLLTDVSSTRLWNASNGLPVTPILESRLAIHQSALTSDNRLVASAHAANRVDLWSVPDGTRFGAPLPHDNVVTHVVFDPNDRWLASAAYDGDVRLWRLGESVTLVNRYPSSSELVRLAFDPSGRYLLAAEVTGAVRVWDVAGGAGAAREPPEATGHGWQLESDRAGAHLLYSQGWRYGQFGSLGGPRSSRALILDPVSGERQIPPLRHEGALNATFGTGETSLLTLQRGEKLRLRTWDVRDGEPLALDYRTDRGPLWGPVDPVKAKNGRLALGTIDGEILFFDLARGLVEIGPPRLPDTGTLPVLDAAGRTVAVGATDGTTVVQEWGPAGEELFRHRFDAPADLFQWSPTGEELAIAEESGTVHLLDLKSGVLRLLPAAHRNWSKIDFFARGGRAMVSSGADGTARLWDVASLRELLPPLVHKGLVYFVRENADASLWLTGCIDGKARLWSPRTGEMISPELDDGGNQFDGGFVPGTDLFATAGTAGLKIRSAAPTELSRTELETLATLLSGRKLVSGVLTHLTPTELDELARSDAGRAALRSQATVDEDYSAWLLRTATYHLEDGEPEGAVPLLEKRLALAPPGAVGARLDFARALALSGDLAGAVRHFRTALAQNDNYPEARYSAALLALANGDADEFSSLRSELLAKHRGSRNPDRAFHGARLLTATPARDAELAQLALTWAEVALDAWRGDREALAIVGAAQIRAGQLDEGIETLRRASAAPGADMRLREQLFTAMAHATAHRWAESEAAMANAELALAALPPSDWEGRLEHSLLKSEVEELRKN